MPTQPRYYALVYLTVTGEVVGEIPLSELPTWSSQVNADGSWSVKTPIGHDGGLTKAELRGLTDSWRFSIAVCWGTGTVGDYICQAGPLVSDQLVSEIPAVLQLGGAGLWGLLRQTMQFNSTWPGVTLAVGADTRYTASLQGIAVAILNNAAARNRMPIDIPAGGTGVLIRSYFGYDFASAGQRLYELTQDIGGPDVYLRPYFADSSHIRHQALVGNPTLSTPGNPVTFDYPGSVISILPTRNGANLSTTTYEKGNGMEYASLWVAATDPTLPAAGWPKLESMDSSLSSSTDLMALQARSNGLQTLHGRPEETWAVTMLMDDADAPFGSYDPVGTATYNVAGHCWLPDGMYTQRLLGFSNGQVSGQYLHILQAVH